MIRPIGAEREAKLRGLASRKGVEVREAPSMVRRFQLYDGAGRPILAEDGTKALSLGDAITVLMRMPNVG
jgi:hypothetical protein